MRYFNTSGPCYPEKHYTVMRETLVVQGKTLVEQGRYFTIFAPRQSGKTTFLHLLFRKLQEASTPIGISFEGLKTLPKPKFYKALQHRLQRQLTPLNITIDIEITDQFDLEQAVERIKKHYSPLVLIIDEFEDIPDEVLSELMHTFRQMYHDKENYGLHSLILVGVSTVAELVVSSASPFNIADELEIPYFSCEEVRELIQQYTTESGQIFEESVINEIYENTKGQPGLVCGLCAHLVEHVATDKTKPITTDDFYTTLKYFLTRKFDKNIINIVQKAREKKDLMLKILFKDDPLPFSVHDPDIAWLYAHGVVNNVNDYVDIAVPLYSKVLLIALKPLMNGETDYYFSAHDTFNEYVTPDGLNMHAILEKYREYIRRRGFRAFDTEHLKEGAWHYSLDNFITFLIDSLEGQTFIEVPTGRGRIDLLILYKNHKYLIETKIFSNNHYFQRGKRQLAEYLHTEGLEEGYYVVFSKKHTEEDTLYFEEEINGKQIYTYIIRTRFEQATKLSN